MVKGRHEENKLHTIYASDFGIELFADLDVAAKFATILNFIKNAYDFLRGFKKLKTDAENLKVDDKLVEAITKQGKEAFDSKLDELTIEIFESAEIKEGHRKQELKNGIRLHLNGLANRIDQGYIFEVRATQPKDAPPELEVKFEPIKAFAQTRFERVEGSRILELPEPDGEGEAKTGDGKPPRKPPRSSGAKSSGDPTA